MAIVSFLLHLTGATMLLLYAVRMVQTGIERAFGASFRRVVTQKNGAIRSILSGLGLAIVLQSSAAVALLVAGFAGAGAITFASGLATVLGADLGSALVIQVLSFPMDWLVPVLLAVGGGFFVKSTRRGLKQAGRILLGIAFILISLRFLRETMDPIRDSAFLPAIAGYLEQDAVSAFIVGAVLAFAMHSSVAVILMCVTLVSVGALPVTAGMSLVLGANLGSAFIPVWLARGMPPQSRRIVFANLCIRGTGALLALVALSYFPHPAFLIAATGAQTLVNVHLAFNFALLIAVPFARILNAPFQILIPDASVGAGEVLPEHRSVLDDQAVNSPHLALSSLKREILRMVQLVQTMCEPVMDLYASSDKERAKTLIAQDKHVNAALDGIRFYMSKLPLEEMSKQDRKLARELTEYAICVEAAGDIVVKQLIPRALQKAEDGVQFSDEGQCELQAIHTKVLANIRLASNVLVSDDLGSARLLLEEKSAMTRMERSSRKKHLKRLGNGAATSFGSSNIHLETLRAYKDLNSQIAAVAYPILQREGQLRGTRLVDFQKA